MCCFFSAAAAAVAIPRVQDSEGGVYKKRVKRLRAQRETMRVGGGSGEVRRVIATRCGRRDFQRSH